jgi:hypothetical protein
VPEAGGLLGWPTGSSTDDAQLCSRSGRQDGSRCCRCYPALVRLLGSGYARAACRAVRRWVVADDNKIAVAADAVPPLVQLLGAASPAGVQQRRSRTLASCYEC